MTKTLKTLSDHQRTLIQHITTIGFGRIENLGIIDGEPRILDDTRLVQTVKLGAERRACSLNDDDTLKRQWVDLFAWFAEVDSGFVRILVIQNHLPFTFELERLAARKDPSCLTSLNIRNLFPSANASRVSLMASKRSAKNRPI